MKIIHVHLFSSKPCKVLVIFTYILSLVQLKASLYNYVTKIEFRETNFRDGSNFNNFWRNLISQFEAKIAKANCIFFLLKFLPAKNSTNKGILKQEKLKAWSIVDYPAGILLRWFKMQMSARLSKILLICFLIRLMFIKQTFLKPLWNKPPPPVFSWNISEFFRTTVLKSTCEQLLLYLAQFNQTI